MRRLKWSDEASRNLEAFLDQVAQSDPAVAARARRELKARAGSLQRLAYQGRPSRWPGWRELTVSHWKKIILYDVRQNEIYVAALLDSRQDLATFTPKSD